MKINFIIHHFSVGSKPYERRDLSNTASVNYLPDKKENKKYSSGNENKLFWYKTDETMNYKNWKNHGLENQMTKSIHHIPTVKSGMDLVNKNIF